MLGVTEAPELPANPGPGHGFLVQAQKVEFDVDFALRSLKGKTEIKIRPTDKDLRIIRLNCRQCRLTSVQVEGKAPNITYDDPYERFTLHPSVSVSQHHFLRKRTVQLHSQQFEELAITLPRSHQIEEVDPNSAEAEEILLERGTGTRRDETDGAVAGDNSSFRKDDKAGPIFRPFKIYIEYEVEEFRDGFHFAGLEEGDCKYPHAYTRNSAFPGQASCLFPCVDSASNRCNWEISVRCPRTLGDAFIKSDQATSNALKDRGTKSHAPNGVLNGSPHDSVHEFDIDHMDLDEEEKSLEFSVIGSGDMVDEVLDPLDSTKKIVSFSCQTNPVAPQHIGFAVGPFEKVDLSEFRDSEQDDMLGTNAVRVNAFALPGRAEEVRNTCMTLAGATDYFTLNFGSYPFGEYKVCFVEDLTADFVDTASLSICSTRLLYPEEVLDPLEPVTRIITNALANQWIGIHIIPSEPEDWWLVVGGALFMSDMFLQTLFGKNEYRFRQKTYADKVAELDVKRPSLYDLGTILHIDPSEQDFMKLKAPAVLFILNQRLIKASGRNGVSRCLHRLLLNAKTGQLQNAAISTANFMHICEKIGHMKLEVFFRQWVYGAGCPQFFVSQRFNKKKMHVEINIRQSQMQNAENANEENLNSHNFMREVKEENHQAYAGPIQPVFAGPMTIRIHEADGTPYEHIIEIKDITTKAEIPYYTKYKRLKRSKRQKERAAAAAGMDVAGDAHDDVLIYCLGDVLQSEEEMRDWSLVDWPKDDDEKMNQESYEWIRLDADFEWLGRTQIAMEDYMFVSQLQQDKDVVAQVDSVRWLSSAHRQLKPIYSTILTRTLADTRYFHGIRTMAANALVTFATSKSECGWVGKTHLKKAFTEMFCNQKNGKAVSRMNDFSDRAAYIIKCAIIKAMARIKDDSGQTPTDVAHFFLERLRDNDNSENDFSDNHYVATLMDALAQTLHKPRETSNDAVDLEAEIDDLNILEAAISLINRFQRSDEWIPSFQNIYTTTALQCQLQLMKKGAITKQMTQFMQYSRPGNSDAVRLKALGCLTELGMLRNDAFAKFLLYHMEVEPSPYVREQAHRILHRGLGQFATGELHAEEEMASRAIAEPSTAFVVEQETVQVVDQSIAMRKKSLDASKAGLKQDLGEHEGLRTAIASALRSTITGINEIEDLLDVCGLLYDTENKLLVKVRMPRYWGLKYHGEGRFTFAHTDKVRWKTKRPKLTIAAPVPSANLPQPIEGLAPSIEPLPPVLTVRNPQTLPPTPSESKPSFKLKFGPRPSEPGVVAVPSPTISTATPTVASTPVPSRPSPKPPVVASPTRKSQIVKLKVSRKRLREWETNHYHGSHSSVTPNNFLHPSTPASHQNHGSGVSSATPPTASAAAAALGWGPSISTGAPAAKRVKLSPAAKADPKARTSSIPSTPPVHAGAAAALMGAGVTAPAPGQTHVADAKPRLKLNFGRRASQGP